MNVDVCVPMKEQFMSRSLLRLLIAGFVAISFSTMASPALAQSGSAASPLSGVVVDKDGGVMPGVTVVVKDSGTGVSQPPVVTNEAGIFNIPALGAGTYAVTVSLQGFKTAVVNDVKITTGVPT